MPYSIALDIGATKILAGLLKNNKVIKTVKKTTLSDKPKKTILNNIENIIRELWQSDITEIGIGFAGQIDSTRGVVVSTGNFHSSFSNIPLKKILEKKFKVKVYIDNDVKCFAKAENKYGWGKQYKNFISLTIGTGIGGAIVVDNKIITGKNNLAGEVGHIKINGIWIDTKNKEFVWEKIASGRAWEKINEKYGKNKADKIIISNISQGLSILATILNPDVFILGGGFIEHPGIISKIKKEYSSEVFHPLLKKTLILPSKIGNHTILLGSLIKK